MSFWHIFFKNIYASSFLEWLGVITSALFTLLITKSFRIAWFFAFFSSLIYIYLAFKGKLFIDSGLNLVYALMAIWGWWQWNSTKEKQIISRKPFKFHVFVIFSATILALILGFVFSFTSQMYPWIDALNFTFSILATYLMLKNILENWLYFIIIDFIMIFVFYSRGYALTSVLFVAYTFLAIYGFFEWRKRLNESNLN